MDDEELRTMRDDARCDVVVKMVEDALWRFNDEHEETLSVYDVMGIVIKRMLIEGLCPACLSEAVDEAFAEANVDGSVHISDDDTLRPLLTRADDTIN